MAKKKSVKSTLADAAMRHLMGMVELASLLDKGAKLALLLEFTREQFVGGVAGIAGVAFDAAKFRHDNPGVEPLSAPDEAPTSTDGGSS